MDTPHNTLEDRLRAVEDTLAIYHLIASHPPAADTGTITAMRSPRTARSISAALPSRAARRGQGNGVSPPAIDRPAS